MKFCLTIFVVIFMTLLSAQQAQAWRCPAESRERAQVNVVPSVGEIQLDRTKNTDDLTRLGNKGAIRDGHHVNGLGGGSIGLEGRASFKILERGDQACIWLKGLNAKFYAYPHIHIASNFPRGSCEYKAVLEHEMKHVKALTDFHEEYTGIFKTQLNIITRRIKPKGPFPLAHLDNIQNQMNERIGREIKSFNDRILPVLERRQDAIDTEAEYARVTAQCSNWPRYY